MTYRVQKEITPQGFKGRVWTTVAASKRAAVAERVALHLRTDGRRNGPGREDTYRVSMSAR